MKACELVITDNIAVAVRRKNANKCFFMWAKAVEKNLKKSETKTEALPRQTALKYCLREDLFFEELLAELMQLASFQSISFVYGKGKRKTQIQRNIDLLLLLRDKRHKCLESLAIAGKRKSYSKTDKDATFMQRKEDYMNIKKRTVPLQIMCKVQSTV